MEFAGQKSKIKGYYLTKKTQEECVLCGHTSQVFDTPETPVEFTKGAKKEGVCLTCRQRLTQSQSCVVLLR